jgi:NAD(P)-dependent dehydrogenase (short-subunit alcohol dehydrogenase family)
MNANGSRVAFVTGANRGLGLETSRQLLEKGVVVVLAGRDRAALDEAVGQLGVDEQGAMTVAMDVTDPASITRARREVFQRFGRVDILINNAAILVAEDGDALEITSDDYKRSFETNVFGVIEVCRAFVPAMAQAGYGRVVNVSSGAGQLAAMTTYAPAYSMSKAALNAFTRLLAHTYQAEGVLVNAVDPGWVRTDMGGPSAPRSPQQGADTIVWLATLRDDGPTGGFFRDRRHIAW